VNIKTGEILRLNASFDELTLIVVELLKGRYDNDLPKTDEEFLLSCKQFVESYVDKHQKEYKQIESP
jgi:hypothetical protein